MDFEIDLQQIFIICILLFGEYILVFLMVMADLVSGCKKAKQRGELWYSYSLRKTVDKLGRYYLPLFALTVIDFMQMMALWYLTFYHGYTIPLFPLMTLIGAIGIGLIEIKSILEKAEDKVKFERVGTLAGDLIKSKDDVTSVIRAIAKYLNENKDATN